MKKMFQPVHTLVIFAASLLAATIAPAQSIWNNSSGNWSTAANWSPNGVPGTTTGVIFTNNAGAANGTVGAVDNTVDSGFSSSIASLLYANTNTAGGAGYYHTTQIGAGQTLTVLGTLKAGTSGVNVPANSQVYASIAGAGTLVVSNVNSDLYVEQSDGANGGKATLDMTNLNTFIATIGGIEVGVDTTIARAKGILYLAKTNTINVLGNSSRAIANMSQIEIGDGQAGGANISVPMYLGIVNNIFVNSITVDADKQGSGAQMTFNPAFTNGNNNIAYFRGTNGPTSRVARWILADNSHQTTTGSGTGTGLCDFTGGTLDAMVDTMTIGITDSGASSGAATSTGVFTFGAGTNNVNTLYLGDRIATGGNSVATATMNVNAPGTLVVNNAICLSFWNGGTINGFYATGKLNINGGTVLAATITNGVTVSGAVVNANVIMTGGTLGITSLLGSIGTTAYPLGIFTLSDSTLQLPVSGLQTNVVVSLLNLNGTTNIINISSIPASVITYPTQIPLIAYANMSLAGAFNVGVSNLPGTYQGYISNNAANSTIDLVLTSGPTSISTLEWKGSAGANWDTTSANWLSGLSTVSYVDGASVLFDDNATGPTSVNLTANRSPASVTISNNALPYAFSGAGIIGGSSLTKSGTGTALFTNSGNTFVGNITINAGTLQFGNGGTSGTLPANGNVLDNGNLIVNRSGNVQLPNAISGGGVLTENGTSVLTVTASNSFSGSTVVSSGTLLLNGVLSGTLASASGSVLGGSGTNAGAVTVSGLIQPSAVSGIPATFTSSDLNLLSGATLAFDLNGPDPTVGHGINDLLNVVGNLNPNNNSIALNFGGVPQTASPYTLITYSGALGGSFNPTVTGTHFGAVLSTSTAGQVNVQLSGSGANLKWDCATNNGFWDVGVSTNWLNAGSGLPDVFYAGDNVLFDDTAVATNLTIASGVLVSPASIVVNANNNNFTFNGGGQINGSGTLLKLGTGKLTINTPNHGFTGTALIAGGLVQAGNNAALVSATTTVTNGATLDIHGFAYVNGPQVVTVSGAGVGGNGALVNNGADEQNAFQNIALAGDATVGGSGRFDMRQSGSNPLTLTSADGNPYNLTVVGTNHFNLVSVTVDGNLGNVDVKGGTFGLQVNTLLNSPAWAADTTKTITVESNAQLSFFNLGVTPLGRNVVLNDGATLYNESGINTDGGLITVLGNDMFQVDNTGTTPTLTISGTIAGPGNLVKTGVATLALQGANTYTGSTLLAAGFMTLNDTASIASSTNVTLAAGTVLDVSPRTDDTLTLAGGQTFQGNGVVNGNLAVGAGAIVSPGTNSTSTGALIISNGVTLGGATVMKLNATTGAGDQIIATNGGIAFGGTLLVTNLSGTFINGQSFQLFVSTNNSAGSFATVILPTATGLTWSNTLATDGKLTAFVSGPPPTPHITSISLSGTSLVINGTNGLAGEQYNILTTTNLALPLSAWTVLPTNTFSAGTFSLTNTVSPGAPQNYYILRVP